MTTSRLLAGASGYSFKEWKGTFYPEDMKPEGMLAWYAGRLPTVEINNTFYQMPKTAVLENWARATPASFRFAIKASRRITHLSRLKADTRGGLGRLPLPEPRNARRQARTGAFPAAAVPEEGSAAAAGVPRDPACGSPRRLRIPQRDAGSPTTSTRRSRAPARRSASPSAKTTRRRLSSRPRAWGYVRLRLENYSDEDLAAWAKRLAATAWQQIYVYFMHEPTAPAYARALMQRF